MKSKIQRNPIMNTKELIAKWVIIHKIAEENQFAWDKLYRLEERIELSNPKYEDFNHNKAELLLLMKIIHGSFYPDHRNRMNKYRFFRQDRIIAAIYLILLNDSDSAKKQLDMIKSYPKHLSNNDHK